WPWARACCPRRTPRPPRARSPPRWPRGRRPRNRPPRPPCLAGILGRFRMRPRLLLLLTAVLALCGSPAGARAEEEAPSLTRALFLEKTAHDPEKALAAFHAPRKSPTARAVP